MFGWRSQRKSPGDLFFDELNRVENKLQSRIDFLDMQLERVTSTERKWDAHITLTDSDLMPLGAKTRVVHALTSWQVHRGWWMVMIGAGVAALLILFLVITLIR